MENKKNTTSIIGASLLVALVLIAFALYYTKSGTTPKAPPVKVAPAEVKTPAQIRKNMTGDVPTLLPKGLATEAAKRFISGEEKIEKGQISVSYQYSSSRSVDENINDFKKILTADGWKVNTDTTLPDIHVITAQKGESYIFGSVSKNSVTGNVLITLNMTIQVKQ